VTTKSTILTITIILLRCRGGYGRRRYIQTLIDQMTTISSSTATETAAYAVTYENKSSVQTRSCCRPSGRARGRRAPAAAPRETCGSTTITWVGGDGVGSGVGGGVGATGRGMSMEGPGSQ
jgi:hypothetical protein